MAIRVHVVAVRNTSIRKLKERFADVPCSTPQKSDGWTWLTASVWGVAGSSLDATLTQLRGPALRVTTEDGVRWFLHLFADGQETFKCCHEFTLLDSLKNVRRLARQYKGQFDHFARDQEVPDEVRKQLKGLSFTQALRQLVQMQAESVADALQTCDIPHDREEVLAVLTGDTVTEKELGWDVGNLPRFLAALGLSDVFAGWEEELEADELEDEDFEEYEPIDTTTPILERVRDLTPVPIEGGIVNQPVSVLQRLCVLVWFCDSNASAAILVRPPEGTEVEADWSRGDYYSVQEVDGELRIGFPSGDALWYVARSMKAVLRLLRDLPDGSVLELVTASQDKSYTAGNQRYRGAVQRGRWHISEAYPSVRRNVLLEALELIRTIDKKGPFKAHSEEEAQAVMEAASRSDWFSLEETLPRRHRRLLYAKQGYREFLAMMIFRQRFRGAWNVEESEREDEQSRREWEEMMSDMDRELKERLSAPRSDEIILQGQVSAFYRSDISRLPQTKLLGALGQFFEQLYEEHQMPEPETENAVEQVDAAMKALGLEPFGDMMCDRFYEVVIRGYGGQNSDTYGVLMAGTSGQFEYEFYTAFDDGSSFTTTTTTGMGNLSRRKIYRRSYPDKGVESLYHEHRKGVEKMTAKGVTPLPAPPTLKALAEAVDDFLVRYGA